MPWNLQIFTGNANVALSEKISEYIGIPLGKAFVGRFSDGEINVQILESVRGNDVFVIQPLLPPVNENLMELLVMIDALKRASAGRITAVVPYYAYARQDRKVQPRVPITAKLVANIITVAGADRVLTVDLHAGQIQGFFDIPVDNLMALPVFVEYASKNMDLGRAVVVSPDAGGVERARRLAKKLDLPLAVIDKRRSAPNVAEVMHVVGDVRDRVAIIIDDIIDTAGTLVKATSALLEKGAVSVYAFATHPVFSGPAKDRIEKSDITKVIVTDTIPVGKIDKVEVLTIAPLIGEAIKRIHINESVSVLFE
ncbi:MAG: ribose-phosphate pyrophosphokinase [Thermosulfidibacteraceae bacterium]|jgi:ribose-phosphate pyrophosphokinase